MTHHIGWSEERVALLRKLWAEGLSGGQIAKQLGGVTRNAVIGKVHRLGLPKRATPGGRAYVPRKRMRCKPRVSNRPIATPSAPPARNMHITRVKPVPAPERKPNKFDDSPASQAAAALLGAAYKREGLSL